MKKHIFALGLVMVMALGLIIPVTAFEDHNYLCVVDNPRLVDQEETVLPGSLQGDMMDYMLCGEGMEEAVASKLSDGDNNGAFGTYLSDYGEYLSHYAEYGEGVVLTSVDSEPKRLAIVIFVPLLIALSVCMIFRSQMKTARTATTAGNYIPADSFHLSLERDQYTHTTTERQKIEKQNSASGSSVDSDGNRGGISK